MQGRRGIPLALLCAASLSAASAAGAQRPRQVVIRVNVTDTNRAPLPNSDVLLVRNGQNPVLVARTDLAGRSAFSFEPERANFYVVGRHGGYSDAAEALPASGDTVVLTLELIPASRGADTVYVNRYVERPTPYYAEEPPQPYAAAPAMVYPSYAYPSMYPYGYPVVGAIVYSYPGIIVHRGSAFGRFPTGRVAGPRGFIVTDPGAGRRIPGSRVPLVHTAPRMAPRRR